DQQLDEISRVVKKVTGINFNDNKRELIKARLGNRLRQLGLSDYAEYLEYLYRKNSGEFEFLVDALTTNVTSFFREYRHFEFLAQQVLSPRVKDRQSQKMRIWSAGCSTGEEPYSIALTFMQTVPEAQVWDFKILATDISANVLARAKQGVYAAGTAASIPENLLNQYFGPVDGASENRLLVKPRVRALVQFARLNLMAAWPMREPFDVIFCRNVMIYFENDVREKLVRKFWELLAPGGWLFVGQSENLLNVRDYFKFIEPAIYRKLG
ncbi:MAG: protein-glutamate O-methyltransferase CheR, partial [Candidatus Firestonebacteria bacterium]|nr:protein-glutamate O-methyltransferase CheR [Candidatus Firestonebacteria bacterium]